jgi:hypothetical protein
MITTCWWPFLEPKSRNSINRPDANPSRVLRPISIEVGLAA